MALSGYGQIFIQATTPQEDPIKVGSLWVDTSGVATLKICTSVSPYTFAEITGGGGAPTDAQYLVAAANASLTAERVTTDTATIAWDHAVAGQAKANVPDDAITYAKLQNVSATDKVLGRSSVGAGDPEEITCTAAGRALLDDVDAAAQRTTLGLGALAVKTTIATADIDANAVTYAKIQDVSAASKLLGRGASAAGDPEEITLGTGLSMTGTTLSSTGSAGADLIETQVFS